VLCSTKAAELILTIFHFVGGWTFSNAAPSTVHPHDDIYMSAPSGKKEVQTEHKEQHERKF
jgi:hypothetical protein